MENAAEILLVEDNLADAELTLRALRSAKLSSRIHVAHDGEEALDFLFCRGTYAGGSREEPPRLVLLDLKLPKVDGVGVLRQIKSDSRTRTIPVVILTSSREDRDVANSYQLGVNSYVQKPVDFDQFRGAVQQLGLYWMLVNQTPPTVRPSNANDNQ
jgi:two-component system response regulator